MATVVVINAGSTGVNFARLQRRRRLIARSHVPWIGAIEHHRRMWKSSPALSNCGNSISRCPWHAERVFGEAEMAGIVLGARVPIILTSRADKTSARLGSCAIALLLARHETGG
jgi:hypothetical protein